MSRNCVGWFEIYVDDLNRAKAFYETVFSLSLQELTMPVEQEEGMSMLTFPLGQMESPGATGALVKMTGYGPSSSGTIVYFSCDDCSVEESRVEAAGGKVIRTKENIGEYGFISLARDSEGNTIGLHSMK